MHFRTQAVLGLALLLSTLTGCAATRHTGNADIAIWDIDPRAPKVTRSISKPSYSSLRGTTHTPGGDLRAGIKPAEFEFSHPRVDDFVAQFQSNLRGFFSRALSRSGRYVPRMSSILERAGVPPQLAYLPLIESGFRTHAVSRAGAVGPWQLIPGTGRRYGLRIDRYVDERRDPVKSTEAAARYLKDLHGMFGDWHLSLAAYNTGEGRISRILEQGRAENFWEMSDRGYLYRETENFVPEFLAALHIAERPETYGFDPPEHEPLLYDRVVVKRPLPLTTVAKLSGASPNEIKELNPALHRGVVPPQGYAVRLPKGTKAAFEVALVKLDRAPKPRVRRPVVRKQAKPAVRKPAATRKSGALAAKRPAAKAVAPTKRPGKAKAVIRPARGKARAQPAAAARRAPKAAPRAVAARQKSRARALD